jgi:acetylglutamate kinase
MIPVISTIGSDLNGQAYNINADTVAGALAAALHAEKVIYLTDVPGLLEDPSDPDSLISNASVSQIEKMLDTSAISSGMIPKVRACIDAVRAGTSSAHMLDGTIPHVLLLELLTDAGIGTMVEGDPQ